MTYPSRAHSYIPGFDGLRAIAVLMVFLHHNGAPKSLAFGEHGVWIFFILSGFLIIRILFNQRIQIESGVLTFGYALKKFYWRRSLRIFPIYFGLLAILSVASAYSHRPISHFSEGPSIYYWTYTANIYTGYILQDWPGMLNHLWSLSVEEQFYILFSPLLLLTPTKRFTPILITVFCLALFYKALLFLGGQPGITVYMDSLVNFGFLVYGGLIGLYADRWKKFTVARYWILAFFALFIAQFLYHQFDITNYYITQTISPLLAGLLVFFVYTHPESLPVRVLEIRVLRYIGTISYGFYLYHPLLSAEVFSFPMILGCLVFALAASSVSYYGYERFFLKLKAKY